MKAISLWQPWATLIAVGVKNIETRGWSTSYRGQLAIHAAGHWTKEIGRMCMTEPFLKPLLANTDICGITRDASGMPFGAIVATCELIGCTPITADQVWPEPERSFGDYTPGRFAWVLSEVRPLAKPVSFKGKQGFFNVPDELLIPTPGKFANA